MRTGREADYEIKILKAVEEVNAAQKRRLAEKVVAHSRRGPDAARSSRLWGLAFKPNTDDMREAPAIVIAEELTKTRRDGHRHGPRGDGQREGPASRSR